ncbi:PAS domain S-box-containing protein [Mariprofundus ferrinatatus]|uniref:histidine kinase n=1 Tax=Mariprofundus ferrinatatus TaxID=1921087 RepID=A0A2K8L568_9PROT|nr:ABC transporter substrate-binding protein [Mariprofundus ferrinatatus]ATX82458.1 PAS domain S-box-containing protein [Mariprofundus ferrinatatus]
MRLLYPVIALLFLLQFFPVVISAHEGDLAPVKLHLKWKHQFQFAGYYAAIEKGFYADEGLHVELIEGGPDKSPTAALLSGDVEFAVGNASAVLDRSESKPVVILASVFQHTAQVIYTRPEISSLKDLKGKKIVMLQNGRRELEAYALLKKFNIHRSDFISLPAGSAEDLVSGKIDAWPGYSSNEAFLFTQRKVPFRMFRPQDFGMDIYGDTLLTTESVINNQPEQADAFYRATIKGWEYALGHVDEMIELIRAKYDTQKRSHEYLKFEADIIIGLVDADLIPVGFSNIKRWQHIADLFEEMGYPVAGVDWDKFIYRPQPPLAHLLNNHLYPYRFWIGIGLLLLLIMILFTYNRQLHRGIRKRTHELEELSTEFREILDHMQDAYYRADLDGKLIWVSASAERQLGYRRDAMIGRILDDFYYEKGSRERYLQALEDSGGRLSHYEICLKHKDGSRFWAEVNSHYWHDGEGELAGVEGNVRDINERKRAQQESEELTGQLQQAQKMESIGVLAGGIAHDFNNLLVGVMGNAELALLDAPENGDMRHYLQQIFKASSKGADLVRQMLAYSGQGRFTMGEQNLNAVIREVSELLSTVIGRKITLNMEFQDGLPKLQGDRNQLTQMLMNLMTNAAESMEGKTGTVTLRTGVQYLTASDFSRVYLKDDLKDGEYIFVEVQDSGCGMDSNTQKLIFDPFFTTKETGSGLGLAALLGIVRSHGGALMLKSEVGAGSCFTIYFPALATTAITDAEEAHLPGSELPGQLQGTVLVVDDEESVSDVARRILEREGLNVISAANGEAGLEQFNKHADEISLVLLDLTMPVLDGEQTFRMMHAVHPEIPVLLSSGFSETEAVSRLQQQGLAGFVRKPYTRNALLHAVVEARAKATSS